MRTAFKAPPTLLLPRSCGADALLQCANGFCLCMLSCARAIPQPKPSTLNSKPSLSLHVLVCSRSWCAVAGTCTETHNTHTHTHTHTVFACPGVQLLGHAQSHTQTQTHTHTHTHTYTYCLRACPGVQLLGHAQTEKHSAEALGGSHCQGARRDRVRAKRGRSSRPGFELRMFS